MHRYSGGVISIVMTGHLTTVTVFETGTWQQTAWEMQRNAKGREDAERPW